jgi:hypothetical protein
MSASHNRRKNRRANENAVEARVVRVRENPGSLQQGAVGELVSYSGPPTADYFLEFDKIEPGESQRELAHFRGQTTHRQSLEQQAMQGENNRAWAGTYISGALCVCMVVSAPVLAAYGHGDVAAKIYQYGLWPFVAVFAVGSATRSLERITKFKEIMK